jgi:hypothetical protein
MATYTRDDLRDAVLQELGVLDVQTDPTPEEAKRGTARCQQQLEYLYDQGLIPFDLDGEIPARYFVPLTQFIAYALALPYGVTNRAQALASNSQGAMVALSKLKAGRYMGEAQQAEYF